MDIPWKTCMEEKGKKNMGKKEIKEEFRVVMPHFLKITIYPKSTSMCFAQSHIQNHRKMSKYYICGSLPSYSSSSSIVYWASLWDLWYELRPHWTKCFITMTPQQGFCNERIRMDTPLLPTHEPVAGGCKIHHNQFSQLLHFLLYFQHLELQKVDSFLPLNPISNNFPCQINGSFLQTQYYSSALSATPILS